MLVLSRKAGTEIIITGGIKITVLQVHGNRVRLGIDAPQETPIRRGGISLQSDATLDQKPT